MEIYHQYIRLRRQFGRHPKLNDEGAEMFADIRPNEEHAKEYIPRNPIITVSQCVPEMSEHDANTEAVILAAKAMNHVEGGWPKDIDCTEAEHTIRCALQISSLIIMHTHVILTVHELPHCMADRNDHSQLYSVILFIFILPKCFVCLKHASKCDE